MHILVVEDEPRVRKVITKYLARQNFTVSEASDGAEAIKKGSKENYDVILLDLMLPKKSGFQVIESLRKKKITTPILVASCLETVEDKVQALNLGADDYVVKEFDLEEIAARLKALLRRPSGGASNIFTYGKLSLNLSDMSVRIGKKDVHLAKKELGILVELIKKPETVVSRQQIIESVWDNNQKALYSNTIDVHLGSLRSKLREASGKAEFIHTVHGHGYILSEK